MPDVPVCCERSNEGGLQPAQEKACDAKELARKGVSCIVLSDRKDAMEFAPAARFAAARTASVRISKLHDCAACTSSCKAARWVFFCCMRVGLAHCAHPYLALWARTGGARAQI
jgi:hypothetical protein